MEFTKQCGLFIWSLLIDTNFCSRCCHWHWDRQASHRHATVMSSTAQHGFQPSVMSMRLYEALTFHVIQGPWWFRFRYGHEMYIARFHICLLLFSAFRPKSGSSCRHYAHRHSTLSAFRPKMHLAFRPFGIPTASQLNLLLLKQSSSHNTTCVKRF